MPEYSVLLIENTRNKKWARTTVRVKAVSAQHAMMKAKQKLGFTKFDVKSARRVPHEGRDYWRKVWKRAYDNIPTRVYVKEFPNWVLQEPNSTTLPEYIKQSAKGMMNRDESGQIYKKEITRRVHKMGAQAALTRLLDYSKWNNKHSMAHYSVLMGMASGSRPRTKERREMLLRLAAPDGMRVAAELLGRKFRPVKIKGKK